MTVSTQDTEIALSSLLELSCGALRFERDSLGSTCGVDILRGEKGTCTNLHDSRWQQASSCVFFIYRKLMVCLWFPAGCLGGLPMEAPSPTGMQRTAQQQPVGMLLMAMVGVLLAGGLRCLAPSRAAIAARPAACEDPNLLPREPRTGL